MFLEFFFFSKKQFFPSILYYFSQYGFHGFLKQILGATTINFIVEGATFYNGKPAIMTETIFKMNKRGPTEAADFPLKQEGLSSHDDDKVAKASAASSSASSQWLKLKDPRIVRVSRAFGGKDRHSKVCTIRGLRDRRVRLSVPTAILLYDLQDRLGLNQPSKVVDWLLNAAKHEIDELPPLPIPPGNITLGYPSLVSPNTTLWKSKPKEVVVTEKDNWVSRNEDEDVKQGSNEDVLPNNVFPIRANHPSFLGLLNTVHPLGYNQLEPSANVGHLANLGFVNQGDIPSNINAVTFPSTLTLSTQPYFPSHVGGMEMDPRQINHYQMLSSSSQNLTICDDLHSSQHLMSQSGKPFSFVGKFNFKQN